jgi:hypothetical protein
MKEDMGVDSFILGLFVFKLVVVMSKLGILCCFTWGFYKRAVNLYNVIQ